MKAVCWYGKKDVRVQGVPDPRILNPRDAIVEVSATSICGSDLHLYHGYMPTMQRGDILGHEFMGRVVAVGSAVERVRVGDRVVVPFPIACGQCWFCSRGETSLCDNTNPKAHLGEKLFGQATCGIFGYSHALGGYAGGQAEYVRVPFADVGCLKVSENLPDAAVLFLSDVLPTGWMAAEQANVGPGDVVAIWGCGPVGQLAIRSAVVMGAERILALDSVPERLQLAADAGAEPIDIRDTNDTALLDQLRLLTGGRGPDVCIEAVGMEAHGPTIDAVYDWAAVATRMETDRPAALRQAILACRKGGTVSLAGVFGGLLDKVPFGAAFNKSLTLKMGQTHVHRYMAPLLDRVERGELDPTAIVTHRLPLTEAREAYAMLSEHRDGCIKVILEPGVV